MFGRHSFGPSALARASLAADVMLYPLRLVMERRNAASFALVSLSMWVLPCPCPLASDAQHALHLCARRVGVRGLQAPCGPARRLPLGRGGRHEDAGRSASTHSHSTKRSRCMRRTGGVASRARGCKGPWSSISDMRVCGPELRVIAVRLTPTRHPPYQGYNGSQCWDTSFLVQALADSGLVNEFPESMRKAYRCVALSSRQTGRQTSHPSPLASPPSWPDASLT